jgi:hypothetical protein
MAFREEKDLGVFLRPRSETRDAIEAELKYMILPVSISYKLATETSPGDLQYIELRQIVDVEQLTDFVVTKLAQT